MEGQLRKKSMHWVELSAQLRGEIDLDCDRCGLSYPQVLDEPLQLQITDTVAQNKEDLDIIEFLDGMIDVAYIVESEINARIEEYHFCPDCAKNNTPVNIEI
jgi:uncharacterized metal-binding protein YceD (DUF177 family)